MIWESVSDVRGIGAEVLGFLMDFLLWSSFVFLALLTALNSGSWFLKPIKVCLFNEPFFPGTPKKNGAHLSFKDHLPSIFCLGWLLYGVFSWLFFTSRFYPACYQKEGWSNTSYSAMLKSKVMKSYN